MATLDDAAVDALLTRARREVDEGLVPACQVALGLDGKVVVHEALGTADRTTRFTIFSATKPFVASVIWQLIGDGLVDPERRVTEYLPSFGDNGKDQITVEQVMLHTSGFPRAPLGPGRWETHQGRNQAFASWRLNWEPGTRFEYHATSAHWVLAELIYAITGEDHTVALRRRVLEPLGLSGFALGLAEDDNDGIAPLTLTGQPASPDELEAAIGIREVEVGEVTDDALMQLNSPSARAVGLPGGGGVSTAADVAAFYQALLHDPLGLWDPVVLHDAKTNVRNHLPDPIFGHSANRSLGLMLAGDDGKANVRGFGRTVSPGAFGHDGAAGQIAWADPVTGLSFCYLTSGRDRNFLREHRRTTALASLAGVCAS
jgi:CubicO group peptidase (beta-lactamase class C family)